jgi:hypothetical protein
LGTVKPNRLKMCGAGADTLKRGEGEGMEGGRREKGRKGGKRGRGREVLDSVHGDEREGKRE